MESQYELHQYYLDILYCMPNIVYWVDERCQLKGFNQQFIKLMRMSKITDLHMTPYQCMAKFMSWDSACIKNFELDDMAVIYSGIAKYDELASTVYDEQGEATYYRVSRIPLFDKKKKVKGLVVILVDVSSDIAKLETSAGQAFEFIPEKKTQNSVHILMVEDNPVTQRVEHALLSELNCDVDVAGSGAAAMSFFKPGKYDLVLMDIGLEDTSGYTVSKKMRQMEEGSGQHVPIVALTSFSAESIAEDCEKYAMQAVMSKPLTAEKAKELIQYFITS